MLRDVVKTLKMVVVGKGTDKLSGSSSSSGSCSS